MAVGLMAGCAASAGAEQPACSVAAGTYRGWQAEILHTPFETLTFTPQLGGRLMQVEFAGHAYLFVNPAYAGQVIPPSEGYPKGKWFNYGGDKVWPMPEGNDDEEHWGGVWSDQLDDGTYAFTVLSQGPTCRVELAGPPDPHTGLQYRRIITVAADSPAISFHAVMTNVSGHPITWSVQSVSQYDTADHRNPGQYNHNFWAFTPANPHSVYLERYHVRSGASDHPSFSVRKDGLFQLHWMYLDAEVWLDSVAPWVAVIDGETQYAMIETTEHDAQRPYPGKATHIFYLNGPQLRLNDQGMPELPAYSPQTTPYYMEAELNSPMFRLQPGESASFDTRWLPTRLSQHLVTVTDAAAVDAPLSARAVPDGIQIDEGLGVFFPGRLVAHLYNRRGVDIQTVPLSTVDPRTHVDLHQTVRAPGKVTRISVHLENAQGLDMGSTGEVPVTDPSQGDAP